MLSGAMQLASEADITTRVISAGQPHRVTPLTGAMCLAVALSGKQECASLSARAGTE